MKSIFTYVLGAFLLSAVGCQKSESEDNLPAFTSESCIPNGQVVKTVTNVEGIISFHSTLNQYYIQRSVPGTFDSIDIGLLCGTVPTGLKVIGSKVLFSGVYKTYDKPSPAVMGGQTFYYLEVTKAQIHTSQ